MSAPTSAQSLSAAAPTIKVIPPYAGPAHGSGETIAAVRVGPFVPAALRPVASWAPTAGVAVATPVASAAAVMAMGEPTAFAAGQSGEEARPAMVVPASIPPYRPLRPTPFAAPATRSPLYIPLVATPAGEKVVEDEGLIEPQLIHTAEFPIPEPGAAVDVEPAVDAHLPWIDKFLASTPALPMAALADPAEADTVVTEAGGVDTSAVDVEVEALAADPVIEPSAELTTAMDGAADISGQGVGGGGPTASVDEWPLDEAAAEFRALRAAMDDQAAGDVHDTGNGDGIDVAMFAPLPEWQDDDLMDIMPIRHSGKTPLSNGAITSDSDLWAERAHQAQDEAQMERAMAPARSAADAHAEGLRREQAEAESTAEEAAHALELLARRVRAGELTLPSYDPRMGEPAALVAALAALLGVKLR